MNYFRSHENLCVPWTVFEWGLSAITATWIHRHNIRNLVWSTQFRFSRDYYFFFTVIPYLAAKNVPRYVFAFLFFWKFLMWLFWAYCYFASPTSELMSPLDRGTYNLFMSLIGLPYTKKAALKKNRYAQKIIEEVLFILLLLGLYTYFVTLI